jgi:DUF971 family protein
MVGLKPSGLELVAADRLRISWNDGQRRIYSVRELRDACPCATCREVRRAAEAGPALLPVLKPEELQPLRITGMKPVGNYAYSIAFSDGHDTGIYTLEELRALGQVEAA